MGQQTVGSSQLMLIGKQLSRWQHSSINQKVTDSIIRLISMVINSFKRRVKNSTRVCQVLPNLTPCRTIWISRVRKVVKFHSIHETSCFNQTGYIYGRPIGRYILHSSPKSLICRLQREKSIASHTVIVQWVARLLQATCSWLQWRTREEASYSHYN